MVGLGWFARPPEKLPPIPVLTAGRDVSNFVDQDQRAATLSQFATCYPVGLGKTVWMLVG